MDVSKTVKINNLAKELLKHGLVKSLDEGVDYAAKFVDKDEVEQTAEMKETKPESNDEISNNIRTLERKLNYLAKSFTEQFNAEMDSLRKQVDLVNSELSSIREKLKTNIVQAYKQSAEEPQQKLQGEKSEAQKDEEIKPRTGDLTPNDVDLENYFYFGGKKK